MEGIHTLSPFPVILFLRTCMVG